MLDDPVAGEATAEGAHRGVDPIDLVGGEPRDLVEAEDTLAVEQGNEFGADALQSLEIVGGVVVERAMDIGAKDCARDIADRGGGFVRQAAAGIARQRRHRAHRLDRILLRRLAGHVRPARRLVAQSHPLARPEDQETDDRADHHAQQDYRPIQVEHVGHSYPSLITSVGSGA